MVNHKEILRLKNLGLTHREIAEAAGCGRNTVTRILARAQEQKLHWQQAQSMSPQEVTQRLFPGEQKRPVYKMPDYEWVHREMQKSGVTLSLLWVEYCEQCLQNGELSYQSTQFNKYYADYVHKTKATMHLEHKPGETMQVDWAGQTASLVDTDTGERLDACLFIAVLPYSGYAYTEAFLDMKQESWITGHVHTVRDVLQAAKEKGMSWPLSDDITNADLEQLRFPDKHKASSQYAEPDYPYIHRELARPGVTLTLLWEEYCAKCHEAGRKPYMSTQFGEHYRRWARITKATMRIQHKPGDAMQVDWAGDTIPVQDPITGEQSAAYLFVAVLPCSCYIYAEACEDMKTENWLSCHVHAFDYFGGAARLLIPDNCKTATLSNTRYDVVLNRSYQELAEHYGTAIVPARVRKPRDKSSAEASVRFAETWIIAALRDCKFFSLRELNESVAEKLEELNSRPFKQMAGCRRSAYLEEEKPYMLPLPASAFEPAVWSVAKVASDYLVTDGRNKYSVPCNLIGERVDIRVTRTTVEVFYHGSRVASHRRLQTRQRDPLVKREHMPPEHQKYLTYNAEEFSRWAMSVGPMTEKVAEHFLKSGKAAEQGYKACAGLTKLEQRYGKLRLEAACSKVLVYSTEPSLRTIASILKNGLDKPDKAERQTAQPRSNSYGITRGAAYFRKGGDR